MRQGKGASAAWPPLAHATGPGHPAVPLGGTGGTVAMPQTSPKRGAKGNPAEGSAPLAVLAREVPPAGLATASVPLSPAETLRPVSAFPH